MASICMTQNNNNNYAFNHHHHHQQQQHHQNHHHQNLMQNNNSYSHHHHLQQQLQLQQQQQIHQNQNQNHNQIQNQNQNQNSYQYLHGINLPQPIANQMQLTQGTQGTQGSAGHQTTTPINHYVQKLPQLAPATPKILCDSNVINIQANPVQSPVSNMLSTMTKKRYTYANMPYGEQLPSVARRNARERNRVKQVNNGFANLRQHIPQTVINNLSNGGRGASKKLSKVDTLRIAVEYIRGLQELLENHANDHETTTTTTTTTTGTATGTTTTTINSTTTHYNSTMPIMNTMMMSLQSDDSSDDGLNLNGHPSLHSPMKSITSSSYQMNHSPVSSSYSDSDISIGGANTFIQPLKLENSDSDDFKFDGFEHFSHLTVDDQPDDEELLDYISSWQDE